MDMWNKIKETKKPIVLYGMGDGADKIISVLKSFGRTPNGVFVSDGFVRDKLYCGMPLMSYSQAKEKFGDMTVLVAFGTALPEVIENIKRINAEQELFVPDVPVYGNTLFDLCFANEHKAELESVYGLLADESSRVTFESIVRYKLTGEIQYLFNCEASIESTYKLMDLKACGTVIDCGAYIGDTAAEYIKYVGNPDSLIAIEPDTKTYKRLCKNCEELPFVKCINAAVSNTVGKIPFKSGGSRSSSIKTDGSEIDCISIDSLKLSRCDYIKMDVEGNESNAINGARETIKSYKPKMFISCYHRSEDIFALPLQILQINPEYKLYMTHYPYIPAWDTAFLLC